MSYYDRQQAAIVASVERLERERPTFRGTDEEWHTYLQNRARLAELETRRQVPND